MQLKQLTMQNFRQFKNATVDFAQGEDGRNVTIVIGENGSGKSTIEQAFFWCLYGETEFQDKSLLNRDVFQDMSPTDRSEVKVILKLIHNGTEYTLIRSQEYGKTYQGVIKSGNVSMNIGYRDKDGNQKYVNATEIDVMIKEILPRSLAKYFFFDGERIEKMGKEITDNKKVHDFEDAVKGLLGLDAIMAAIRHLDPKLKKSVCYQYGHAFNAGANKELQDILKRIDENSQKIEIKKEEQRKLEEDAEQAEAEKKKASDEIRSYEEGKKLYDKKDALEKDIEAAEVRKHKYIVEAAGEFMLGLRTMLSLSLINKAADFVNSMNLADAGIPYVRKETLDYLIRRGHCICGRDLTPNTDAYHYVYGLYDLVAPKSISGIVKDFKTEGSNVVQYPADAVISVEEKVKEVSTENKTIADKTHDLDMIVKGLPHDDNRERISTLNRQIDECSKRIKKDQRDRDAIIAECGALKSQIEADVERRTKINAESSNNRKIERYLNYSKAIYDRLLEEYSMAEEQVRMELENTINEIFKDIYKGDLHLTIGDNYHISVRDTMYDSGVETSSGQSIAVIFAFITALIKLAKENARKNENDESALPKQEIYPLVMDAPLSLFDKTRIDTVCRTIPTIADQVVIFIKDTDGDLAMDKMSQYIGKRYRFDKNSEFETDIVPEA